MKRLALLACGATSVLASPALAASGPFFSLNNSNFIVLIAFILFVGILLYAKVPGRLTGLLDKRAEGIKFELEEAKALREEARGLLASYEKKHKEVIEQAERIVNDARKDAMDAAAKAKEELKLAIARRLQAAEEQIASAEAGAIRQVREQAISIAIAAASDVLAKQTTAESAAASIDAAITQVAAKLH